MIARINPAAPFRAALRYNENKLLQDKAVCLLAENFPAPAAKLDWSDKLKYFDRIVSANERSKKNGLQISLNFDPSEKMGPSKLVDIARDYMNRIGFGAQPYLVYQHHDAGHPHIHIVTVLIREDGKRTDIHNLVHKYAEGARKQIEKDHQLVRAGTKKDSEPLRIQPQMAQKAQYGKMSSMRTISTVLDHVLTQFKFTSLAGLNQVLRQFNVLADRGKENSLVFFHHGLNYFILDERGKKIGTPIKASRFDSRPTLSNLEDRFKENLIRRAPDLQKLKTALDWALATSPKTVQELTQSLKEERIHLFLDQNENGKISGLGFIDYRTKAVFTDSDLGTAYNPKILFPKMGLEQKGLPGPDELKKENIMDSWSLAQKL
jgi:hypothetical protein